MRKRQSSFHHPPTSWCALVYQKHTNLGKDKEMKRCTVCGVEKEIQEFNPRWDRPSCIRSECKQCQCKRHHQNDDPVRRKLQNNARSKVRTAIKSGKLVRSLTCEMCGSIAFTQAHHFDYQKPLDVIWLCSSNACHKAADSVAKMQVAEGITV